jgi:hypothetical protein
MTDGRVSVPFTLTANDPSIFVQGEPHDPEFSPLTQVNQMFPSWKRINE